MDAQKMQNEVLNLPMEIENLNASALNNNSCVLDSAAMRHSGDASKTDFGTQSRSKMEEQLSVRGVHGDSKPVTDHFQLKVPSAATGKDVVLTKAIDIPGTAHNLVSVGLLDDAGFTTVFKDGEGKVFDKDDNLVMYAEKINGLYRLRSKLIDQLPQAVVNYDTNSLKLAHDLLGHRSFDVVRKMLNLPKESVECLNPVCKSCLYAQMRSKKKKLEGLFRAPRYGYRLHSDTSAKLPAANAYGEQGAQRYMLTGDEFSDTLFVEF